MLHAASKEEVQALLDRALATIDAVGGGKHYAYIVREWSFNYAYL